MKEFIEKVKVTSLQIIVTGCKNKPYFQIKYKEVGKEDYNIGYGSYDLNNVFNWKEDCFEIANQLTEEYAKDTNVQTIDVTELVDVGNDGWTACSEKLPEQKGNYLVFYDNKNIGIRWFVISEVYRGWSMIPLSSAQPIAWQPLPQPYQPKGK